MNLFPQRVTQAIKHCAAALSMAAFGVTALAQETQSLPDLVPFEASYTAYKWDDDIGGASMKLESLAENQYSLTYSSDVSKFFLSDERFEHSIFFVRGHEIEPYEYHYKRTGTGPDTELDIQFTKQPEPTVQIGQKEDLPWQGELDNQLYRIDIARQLAAGNEKLSYQFINYRGEKREYGIKVMGPETLSLPYGKLKTIKVKLVRDNNSRETYAWFAPKLDYNLVRLRQFKDGDEQGDIKLNAYRHL